jgi:hypothetical protein
MFTAYNPYELSFMYNLNTSKSPAFHRVPESRDHVNSPNGLQPKFGRPLKANFHSGKLSVDWNGQENFSLSCELWVGTNDFNTKKNVVVRSNPRIVFLSGNFPEWKIYN